LSTKLHELNNCFDFKIYKRQLKHFSLKEKRNKRGHNYKNSLKTIKREEVTVAFYWKTVAKVLGLSSDSQ